MLRKQDVGDAEEAGAWVMLRKQEVGDAVGDAEEAGRG